MSSVLRCSKNSSLFSSIEEIELLYTVLATKSLYRYRSTIITDFASSFLSDYRLLLVLLVLHEDDKAMKLMKNHHMLVGFFPKLFSWV